MKLKARKQTLLLFSILLAVSVISVSADISASLGIVDKSTGTEISGEIVRVGVTAEAAGYYKDPTHGLNATANMTVLFKGPSDPAYVADATLFTGIVTSGSTTIRDYNLTKVGTYKFKWEVGNEIDEALITTSLYTVVGGFLVPTDKLALLAPWIVLAATVTVAAVSVAVYKKKYRGF